MPALASSLQRGWGMRCARVALIPLFLAMTGCLIPQDDQTLVIPPPPRNRPPRFVTNQITPPQKRVIRLSTAAGCQSQQEFQVFVADPDVDDPLTVRWYVDYDADIRPGAAKEEVIQNVAKELRNSPSTYNADVSNPLNPLAAPGPHLLEVLVSDGILSDRTPQPRAPDPNVPDAGPQETFVALWSWLVISDPGSCGP